MAAPYSAESTARDGESRPSTRSKYARLAAGPPFTTTSRSGVKTSVATSPRSCSAARSRAPLRLARLPLPSSSVTPSSTVTPARSPRNAIRAASRPKRTSCASARVRGENPCVPTCSDSRRLVLPAPLGPVTSTRPGSSSRSSLEYERKSRREAAPTISPRLRHRLRCRPQGDRALPERPSEMTGRPAGSCLPRQTDRHDQVQEVVALALEHGRPQRADQLQPQRLAGDRLDPVPQELGVEPDLERLGGKGNRQRLAGLADLLRLRRDDELAVGEAKPQRRVALRHHRDTADDLEQLVARQRDLVLEGLRHELLVVRELPVDAARRQPGGARPEDHLVR